MTILGDIGLWLWRLLPANPILVRVVSMGGKRVQHLLVRTGYLVALFLVMLIADTKLFGLAGASLAALAKQSSDTFLLVSFVQLVLASFIAPIFTAGAITQEKDANTLHILLTTPLSSAQIVFGSLFSRLYFIWVLLLSGLPIFCITMIFGGVTTAEVFASVGLAACTGLLTGALAIFISVARVGTRRTILSFFVGVAVYLLGLAALGSTTWGQLAQAPLSNSNLPALSGTRMSWLAPFHPFLALFVVSGQTPPPEAADVARFGWPLSWMLVQPHYGYMALTTTVSLILVLLSLAFLRSGAKEGEATVLARWKAMLPRAAPPGERRKRPRHVWNDPIAWREAATRGSTAGRSVLRWVFAAVGILGGLVLLIAHYQAWGMGLSPSTPGTVRDWLTAIVWIEFAVILLVVTNTAAATLTREKESQSLELLITTPLTSGNICWGMLRGLISFAIPFIAVPTATVLFFAFADLFAAADRRVTTLESVLLTPLLITSFAALAGMIGLLFSLQSRKTVRASMLSTAVVLGLAGVLWACVSTLASMGGAMAAVVMSFSPFPALQTAIHPAAAFGAGSIPPSASELASARVARLVTALVAVAIYAWITRKLWSKMVSDFDMTIRRQTT